MKYLYLILGYLFVGIAFLGIIVPGLPTVPFLLLAAACFVKSSPRLYNWLLNHKIFGPAIKDYMRERSIPLKIKLLALSMMLIMLSFSVIKVESLYLKIFIILLGLAGIIYILSVKTKR